MAGETGIPGPIPTGTTSKQEYAKAVAYEYEMLRYLVDRVDARGVSWQENSARIESALVHTRNLLDFFNNQQFDTDIKVGEFLKAILKDKFVPRFKYLDAAAKSRINREVSHLTQNRAFNKSRWDFKAIFKEMKEHWDQLMTLLSSEQKAWFVYDTNSSENSPKEFRAWDLFEGTGMHFRAKDGYSIDVGDNILTNNIPHHWKIRGYAIEDLMDDNSILIGYRDGLMIYIQGGKAELSTLRLPPKKGVKNPFSVSQSMLIAKQSSAASITIR